MLVVIFCYLLLLCLFQNDDMFVCGSKIASDVQGVVLDEGTTKATLEHETDIGSPIKRLLEPVVECNAGDLPLFCDTTALPERCADTSYLGCGVLCDNHSPDTVDDENAQNACERTTFQEGSVDCKDGACFNASFVDVSLVKCYEYHASNADSCRYGTFENVQVLDCDGENACDDSSFTNMPLVECRGGGCDRGVFTDVLTANCMHAHDCCQYSIFHRSRVECSNDYSCERSEFYASAASCAHYRSCRSTFFDGCSCCNGSYCPALVPACTEDFCLSFHLGRTCKDWGNPFCEDFDSASPSGSPTVDPTASPTAEDSESPTIHPTDDPSTSPTTSPTSSGSSTPIPTLAPSFPPTAAPVDVLTEHPTIEPTNEPSSSPTSSPSTKDQTKEPSVYPSTTPTTIPTSIPSFVPSDLPSSKPRVVTATETTTGTAVNVVLTPEEIFGSPDAELDDESLEILQEPTNGEVTFVSQERDLEVDYTPDPEFEGTDEFTFMACDVDGTCVPLKMEFTVAAEDKGREGLYALLALVLAPLLCLCQEPWKKLYEKLFHKKDECVSTKGKAVTATIATGSTPGSSGIPTSIYGIDQTSFASHTSVPVGNDPFDDEDDREDRMRNANQPDESSSSSDDIEEYVTDDDEDLSSTSSGDETSSGDDSNDQDSDAQSV